MRRSLLKEGLRTLTWIFLIAACNLIGNATASIAQNCRVSLANHAGNEVTIQAELKSPDWGEAGEGESMTVVSSGGEFIQLIRAFNSPRTFKFTATMDNESIFGVINGEGDESCELVVTVNKTQRLFFGHLVHLVDLSDQFAGAATQAGVIAEFACPFLPNKSDVALCKEGFEKTAAGSAFVAWALSQLQKDPPDPNYKVIASPVIASLPPVAPDNPTQVKVSDAFHELVQNEEGIVGLANVILVCFNRAQGVAAAGDTFWEAQQMAAARRYQNQLGVLLDGQQILLENLISALQAWGFPAINPVVAKPGRQELRPLLVGP